MTYKCYFESREFSGRGADSLAADLARHLHARQYLGRTVIVCDNPIATLSALRKQWLKLSRYVQKQRASTLNADKILKYTHTITHMQHLKFTTKTPIAQPDCDVYVLSRDDTSIMPPGSWSVYAMTKLPTAAAKNLVAQLPGEALITDYAGANNWEKLGCKPKAELEVDLKDKWQQALHFLRSYRIDIDALTSGDQLNVEALDDALDTLLGASHKFLSVASEFQRTLELARPLRVPKKQRSLYDSFILLAHRVQALSQTAFTQRFLETYNEDDTFFLHDNKKIRLATLVDITAENIARQLSAGRWRLADALIVAQKLERTRPYTVGLTLQNLANI